MIPVGFGACVRARPRGAVRVQHPPGGEIVSRTSVAIVALLGFVMVAPARAGSWSLGAQMGAMTVRSRAGSGTSTVVALPLSTLTYQPGFRLGYGDGRHAREACLEGGALVVDEVGSMVTIALGSLGYQYVLKQQSDSSPYANVGAGILSEGSGGRHGSSLLVGAGLGMRRVVHDERGTIRVEARYDFLRGGGPFGRPYLNTMSLRLGFDLWLWQADPQPDYG